MTERPLAPKDRLLGKALYPSKLKIRGKIRIQVTMTVGRLS